MNVERQNSGVRIASAHSLFLAGGAAAVMFHESLAKERANAYL